MITRKVRKVGQGTTSLYSRAPAASATAEGREAPADGRKVMNHHRFCKSAGINVLVTDLLPI
jgi:hypothetical protein